MELFDSTLDALCQLLQDNGIPAVAIGENAEDFITFETVEEFTLFQQTENASGVYAVLSSGGAVEL